MNLEGNSIYVVLQYAMITPFSMSVYPNHLSLGLMFLEAWMKSISG